MNKKKGTAFLELVTPVIEKLNNDWFPADEKSPEGSFYACTFCDQNCSKHDKHDDTCLYELGKQVTIQFKKIEADQSYLKDFRGNNRSEKDLLEIRKHKKVNAVLNTLYKKSLTYLIPLDYSDKSNHNIVCHCYLFLEWKTKAHTSDCPNQILAHALSELFKL
jgi:hypothetical protein